MGRAGRRAGPRRRVPHPAAAAQRRSPGGQRLRDRRRRRAGAHRRRLGVDREPSASSNAAWPRSSTSSPTSGDSSSPTPIAITTPRRSPSGACSARRSAIGEGERPTLELLTDARPRPARRDGAAAAARPAPMRSSASSSPGDRRREPAELDRLGAARLVAAPGSTRAAVAHARGRSRRPGHTSGHVVFHDAANAALFAGDHVLPRITPSIGIEPAGPACRCWPTSTRCG